MCAMCMPSLVRTSKIWNVDRARSVAHPIGSFTYTAATRSIVFSKRVGVAQTKCLRAHRALKRLVKCLIAYIHNTIYHTRTAVAALRTGRGSVGARSAKRVHDAFRLRDEAKIQTLVVCDVDTARFVAASAASWACFGSGLSDRVSSVQVFHLRGVRSHCSCHWRTPEAVYLAKYEYTSRLWGWRMEDVFSRGQRLPTWFSAATLYCSVPSANPSSRTAWRSGVESSGDNVKYCFAARPCTGGRGYG